MAKQPNLSGPEVMKLFSCSGQLAVKFKQLIKTKMFLVFIMLINVKMPTFVSILTFMCMISSMLS